MSASSDENPGAEAVFLLTTKMTRKESSSPSLRIGVDFGFRFTGLALMDGARVLARVVATHRTGKADISQTLKERRANRAMRRRARSRRKRLRDFRALLKEIKIPAVLPALDEKTKALPGNRLYAVAHWRGWDYAELVELLMEEADDNPKSTAKVREVDNFLKRQNVFPVPDRLLKQGKKPTRGKGKTDNFFRAQTQAWEEAENARQQNRLREADAETEADLTRWVELQTSCLGGLADAFHDALDAEKKAEENPGDETLAAAAEENRDKAEALRELLDGEGEDKVSQISEWIDGRLDLVFDGELPEDKRDMLRGEIMVRLGLDDGRKLHRDGKLYAPNRNRHRAKALNELGEKLRLILRDEGREGEYKEWRKRAEKILTRRQRPQKANNRNPGKCPAVGEKTGVRCGNNLPRRDKPEIRRLLFEIAARQMNIRPEGAMESRKLTEDELRDLLACADFDKGEIDGKKWREFFVRLPTPPAKRDEDGEELRAMRDQLRDIVRSGKKNRTALCKKHMRETLQLLKEDKTESPRWSALHGRRILGRADAKPALLHRADAICAETRRMLAAARFPNPRKAPVVHVGVESARFDIASLSANEGRKMKKSAYGKKRGRPRRDMARAQDWLCILCGEKMDANVTVDHIFARARRGGDSHKNRAAMCAACNTRKWKFGEVQLHPDALNALAKNGQDAKAAFLQALAARGEKAASEVNLAAAQTTMFGAQIVRGMLAEELIGDLHKPENAKKMTAMFPVQRAADLARVREAWFPNINRQKRALRARKASEDEKKKKLCVDLCVDDEPEEVPGTLQNSETPLPSCVRVSAPGKLRIEPAPGRECVCTLWLEEERRETVTLQDGKEHAINLRRKGIQGKLAAANGEADREKWPFEILSREDGILTLRARDSGPCELLFNGRLLRVIVRPAKNDPVRDYHHAVDAVVAAAQIDWGKIAHMAADARKRNAKANDEFNLQLQNAKPLDANGDPFPDSAPPEGDDQWLLPDRVSETGSKRAKTKREPLGLWKDPKNPDAPEILIQRCRLDRIARKDLNAIIPPADEIRQALEAAWREVGKMPEETRKQFVNATGSGEGRREFLSDQWFLQKRREAWDIVNALPPERRAEAVRVRRERDGGETEFIREQWFRENWKNRAAMFADPLRVRSVPLEVGRNVAQKKIAALTRKELARIPDSHAAERSALDAAFQNPQAVLPGKQPEKDRLNPEWLAALDEKDILHPDNTAAVPMQKNVAQKKIAKLTREELARIPDSHAAARSALGEAFQNPQAVLPGKQPETDRLNPEWLAALDEKNILHPDKTAEVPVRKKPEEDDDDRINPRDRAFAIQRRGATHRFDRVENWGETVLWKKPDGSLHFARRRPPFYRNRHNCEWETEKGEDGKWKEKKPEAADEIIAHFKRGDQVQIAGDGKTPGEEGLWRVVKLDKGGATLAPLDDDAHRNLPDGQRVKNKKWGALRPA